MKFVIEEGRSAGSVGIAEGVEHVKSLANYGRTGRLSNQLRGLFHGALRRPAGV